MVAIGALKESDFLMHDMSLWKESDFLMRDMSLPCPCTTTMLPTTFIMHRGETHVATL